MDPGSEGISDLIILEIEQRKEKNDKEDMEQLMRNIDDGIPVSNTKRNNWQWSTISNMNQDKTLSEIVKTDPRFKEYRDQQRAKNKSRVLRQKIPITTPRAADDVNPNCVIDTGNIARIRVNFEKGRKQDWTLSSSSRSLFAFEKRTWNITCDFCGQADVFTGKLPGPRRPFLNSDKNGFGPMLESKRMGLKAHQKCLWYHADGGDGNETNLDPGDNFESFSANKIKERIKKHSKKKCFFCKGLGATTECFNKNHRAKGLNPGFYHYPCAVRSGEVYIGTNETFCRKHAPVLPKSPKNSIKKYSSPRKCPQEARKKKRSRKQDKTVRKFVVSPVKFIRKENGEYTVAEKSPQSSQDSETDCSQSQASSLDDSMEQSQESTFEAAFATNKSGTTEEDEDLLEEFQLIVHQGFFNYTARDLDTIEEGTSSSGASQSQQDITVSQNSTPQVYMDNAEDDHADSNLDQTFDDPGSTVTQPSTSLNRDLNLAIFTPDDDDDDDVNIAAWSVDDVNKTVEPEPEKQHTDTSNQTSKGSISPRTVEDINRTVESSQLEPDKEKRSHPHNSNQDSQDSIAAPEAESTRLSQVSMRSMFGAPSSDDRAMKMETISRMMGGNIIHMDIDIEKHEVEVNSDNSSDPVLTINSSSSNASSSATNNVSDGCDNESCLIKIKKMEILCLKAKRQEKEKSKEAEVQQERVGKLMKSINSLQQNNEEKEKEITRLQDENAAKEQTNAEQGRENTKLQDEIAVKENIISEKDRKLEEKQRQLDSANVKLQRADDDKMKAEKKVAEYAEWIRKLHRLMDEMPSPSSSVTEENEDLSNISEIVATSPVTVRKRPGRPSNQVLSPSKRPRL